MVQSDVILWNNYIKQLQMDSDIFHRNKVIFKLISDAFHFHTKNVLVGTNHGMFCRTFPKLSPRVYRLHPHFPYCVVLGEAMKANTVLRHVYTLPTTHSLGSFTFYFSLIIPNISMRSWYLHCQHNESLHWIPHEHVTSGIVYGNCGPFFLLSRPGLVWARVLNAY